MVEHQITEISFLKDMVCKSDNRLAVYRSRTGEQFLDLI